ncbi:MAG: CinA family protein [Tatlockia sp.]|nr:CinA family protein [Tatlockia sp.]
MDIIELAINYLRANHLKLATAESCTAGQIAALLGENEGCGECLEAGYVVYSIEAKKSILGVSQKSIDKYTLTSEQVAREMVRGAIKRSKATIGIATTGITGEEPMDGIEPGTICLAYAAFKNNQIHLESETIYLKGERGKLQREIAYYALKAMMHYYERIK